MTYVQTKKSSLFIVLVFCLGAYCFLLTLQLVGTLLRLFLEPDGFSTLLTDGLPGFALFLLVPALSLIAVSFALKALWRSNSRAVIWYFGAIWLFIIQQLSIYALFDSFKLSGEWVFLGLFFGKIFLMLAIVGGLINLFRANDERAAQQNRTHQ